MPETVLITRGFRIHTIPKVASSSMSAAVDDYRRVSTTEEGREFRFAAVRHPLDRLVSAWAFFCRRPIKHGLTGWVSGDPFDAFLGVVLERPQADKHVRPQVDYLHPDMGLVAPLESLSEAWAGLGLGEIPVKNATARNDWRGYKARPRLMRAEEVYSADLEVYHAAQEHFRKKGTGEGREGQGAVESRPAGGL